MERCAECGELLVRGGRVEPEGIEPALHPQPHADVIIGGGLTIAVGGAGIMEAVSAARAIGKE